MVIANNVLKGLNDFILHSDLSDENQIGEIKRIYYDWLWIPEYNPDKNVLKDVEWLSDVEFKISFTDEAYTPSFKKYLREYKKRIKSEMKSVVAYAKEHGIDVEKIT